LPITSGVRNEQNRGVAKLELALPLKFGPRHRAADRKK
jgi:hypothetical protein